MSLRAALRYGTGTGIASVALVLALMAGLAGASTLEPVIRSVKPLKVEVGQKLTITGTGFRPGHDSTTVVFQRDGGRPVFVKADTATTTTLTLTVPAKLLPAVQGQGAGAAGTLRRFRLRVLADRFGRAFTSTKLSPEIGAPGALGSTPGCVPNFKDPTADSDGDGTPDVMEKRYGTDPCKKDTDGDGVSDTFEIESALDLNGRALPFPGKHPYPNPLDASDANTDFDGDGLTMTDEYNLWMYTTGGKLPLTYSDGTADTSVDGTPTLANGSPRDADHDGILTDDEKDADHDGLSNWDESHGRMTPGYWASVFPGEKPFFGAPGAQLMSGTSMVDPDTNGDGVPDGQDDQDHDGYTNIQELDRHTALAPGGGNLWVNPFNPCLPDPSARTCTRHPPLADPWAPFPLKTRPAAPLTTTDLGPDPGYLPQP